MSQVVEIVARHSDPGADPHPRPASSSRAAGAVTEWESLFSEVFGAAPNPAPAADPGFADTGRSWNLLRLGPRRGKWSSTATAARFLFTTQAATVSCLVMHAPLICDGHRLRQIWRDAANR